MLFVSYSKFAYPVKLNIISTAFLALGWIHRLLAQYDLILLPLFFACLGPPDSLHLHLHHLLLCLSAALLLLFGLFLFRQVLALFDDPLAKLFCDTSEDLLNIDVLFGACFMEICINLGSESFALFYLDCTLLLEVAFCASNGYHYVFAGKTADIFEPARHIFKGAAVVNGVCLDENWLTRRTASAPW